MIYNTPYDTTMGRVVPTDPIAHQVKVCMVKESVDQTTLSVKIRNRGFNQTFKSFFITGLYSSEEEIPFFSHPLLIPNKGTNYCVSDMRLFVNAKGANKSNIEGFAKNKVEYNFAKARNILTLAWISGDIGQIKNSLRFAREVFASFIAQTVSRAYYLDPGDQQKIQILANYFYNLLFLETEVADESTYFGWVSHTIENTKATSKQVEEVFAQVKNMSNLENFCKTINSVCNNPRLNDFNHLALLTLVRNTWFGTNAKDIIQVSLEHPPTWVSMVYTALTERTFKQSQLTKVAEFANKRGSGGEFINCFNDLIMQYLEDDKMSLENFGIKKLISVGQQIKPFDLE